MIYAFCGMPLAGKSTHSKKLARELGLPYFSTGDYARSMGMGDEPSIKSMDLSERFNGWIVAKATSFVGGAVGRCIIDGFPRSAEQYLIMLEWHYDFKIVFMTANPLVIFDRLEQRARAEGRPEDEREVVLGRVRRSVEWRAELKALAGEAFMDISEEIGYDAIKRRLECGE